MSALPPDPAGSDGDDDDRTVIRVPTRSGATTGGGVEGLASGAPASAPAPAPATEPIAAAVAASVATTGAAAAERDENALAAGTMLGEFEITEVLGIGGFGIVYLALDRSLHRKVAVKEYMPTALAARQGPTEVRVKSPRHRDTFDAGLKSFVNEARLLAQFDHPALVKVYRFWEAHGTAYMVMPFYEGVTLKETLSAMQEPPSEAWLRNLLAPLTEALQVIHSEQCFHRDIAPDNVILLKGSNRPLLLDFGAARRVIGDMTQALTVILKPGYAPLEQYAEVPGMKQGAWTDVYALCAVVYYAIVGKTPPTSVGRLVDDHFVPLAQQRPGQYTDRFLRAIDHGLVVLPQERTQSIEALRSDLGLSATRFDPDITQQVELPSPPARPGEPTARAGEAQPVAASTGATPPAAFAAAPAVAREAAVRTRSRMPLIAGAAVVVLAAAGYFAFSVMAPNSRPPGAATVADVAAPGASAVAPASSPIAAVDAGRAAGTAPSAADSGTSRAVDPAQATTAPAPTATAAATSTQAATAASPALAPRTGPLDVSYEFDRIVQGQAAGFDVIATPAKPTVRIDRDRLSFKVTSARDGFVYVLLKSTEGAFMLLLPNEHARGNAIKAGQSLSLPPSSWPLDVAGPPGTDQFLVIVSASPRDFSATGLKNEQGIGRFPDRPTGASPSSPYAGEPRCKAADACSVDYGAARFSVVETR